MSFMSMFLYSFNTTQAGWIFMWVILGAGVFGLAIALERFFFLTTRSAFRIELFVKEIIGNIQNNDLTSAQRTVDKAGKMALAQVFRAALREAGAGAERIRNAGPPAISSVPPPRTFPGTFQAGRAAQIPEFGGE